MATRIEQLISQNGSNAFPFKWTGPCLVCDDVEVALLNNELKITNGCESCEQEIRGWMNCELPQLLDQNESIQLAARTLQEAKLPLICGLTDQSVQTQYAAVEMAKSTNAVVDWTIGNGPIAFHRALQNCGSVSCTYGEVTERSDLAVFWPETMQGEHENFTRRFLRPDTPTVLITWDRKQQLTAIRWLRAGLLKQDPSSVVGEVSVEFAEELTSLQERLNAARYPVIVVDESLAHSLGNAGVLSMHRFVRAQNDINNCRLVHLGRSNAAGIAMAMTTLAGAPFGVGFRNGKSIYRGREFSVESLLGDSGANPKADLLFLIGSPDQLPEKVPSGVKTIWICDQPDQSCAPEFKADIELQAGRWGCDVSGTGCRADGIPVQRDGLLRSEMPSVVDLLTMLQNGLIA